MKNGNKGKKILSGERAKKNKKKDCQVGFEQKPIKRKSDKNPKNLKCQVF